MALSGSEKDKQRLVSASRNLYDCVYVFVSSSNIMFRMLNQYLKTEFANVVVRENLSIKENLQLLMSALKEMQETVDTKAKEVQQRISEPLYAKITLTSTSKEERTKLVKEISSVYSGDLSNVCAPITTVLFKHGNLPDKLESVVRNLVSCPVVVLRVGDLLMSHAEIAKAFPMPTTSTTPPPPVTGARVRSTSLATAAMSLTSFMRTVLQGQSGSKSGLALAASQMEDAVKLLKPVCGSFQSTVKTAEEYVTLILDKLQ
ncbi:hypothetical protein lerEdw1_003882 [Lerista edwardsae]|nr:hypothetical protein lerEdw1_003882 [Lerista edwardsae]